MTPLERAARALHEATRPVRYIRDCTRPAEPPVEHAMPFTEWDDLTDAERGAYTEQVRAVIEAIREPSEEMKRVGTAVTRGMGDDKYWADGVGAYEAMIDALLAEGA